MGAKKEKQIPIGNYFSQYVGKKEVHPAVVATGETTLLKNLADKKPTELVNFHQVGLEG